MATKRRKVQITFQEVVTYEAELKVPASVVSAARAAGGNLEDYLLDTDDSEEGDGEPRWFHLLEQQAPGWSQNRVAGVESRSVVRFKVEPLP
jgi:hypothetical protein